MLLIASGEERRRALVGMAAHVVGSSILFAANFEEACAHLDRETVVVYRGRHKLPERCSITGAIVMLDFEDGWQLCRRIHALNEGVPVLWVVPVEEHERALAMELGRHDPGHLPERFDIFMVIAWLKLALPARIACEARRRARGYGLRASETEVLVRYAQHVRDIPLAELAREMKRPWSTVRGHCNRIQQVSRTTMFRLAASVRCHICGGPDFGRLPATHVSHQSAAMAVAPSNAVDQGPPRT